MLRELRASGMPTRQIAKEVGITPAYVRALTRIHQGLPRVPVWTPTKPHTCDLQCAQVRRLRAGGLTMAQIGERVGLTREAVCHVIISHNHHLKQAGGRIGFSYCLTCRRRISPSMPATALLSADECCGWCGRRWDGDIRCQTPALIELARKLGTNNVHQAMQAVHSWQPRERRNSSEVRARQLGPSLASQWDDADDEADD